MPSVHITTNVSKSKVTDTKEVLTELTKTASVAIGKPEKYFVVIVHYNADLAFGGDPSTPAAYTEVSSIGSIGGAKNANIVESLSGVIERRLGVPPDRCYINFHDIAASDWGWRGSTFEELMSGAPP